MTAHPWKCLAVFGAVILIAITAFYILPVNPTSHKQPPRKNVAEYEAGYLPIALDSGELTNNSNNIKLLYRVPISHPDPKAEIQIIFLTGTELGEGSFIRVGRRSPTGSPLKPEDYDYYYRIHLHRFRYRVFGTRGNPVILELWGAPNTRNRLRVEKIRFYYPDRPIVRDIPPSAPRPASGGG